MRPNTVGTILSTKLFSDQSQSSTDQTQQSAEEAVDVETLWSEFKEKFPTEEHCWIELFRIISKYALFRCRNCFSESIEHVRGRNVLCTSCFRKGSLTVGTLLERCRRAEPWMIGIWMTERGVALSSIALHKLADIAQSSALNILRKIRIVLEKQMGENAAGMASNEFSSIMNRRSLFTPSRMHPRTEEDEHAKEAAQNNPHAQETDAVDDDDDKAADPLTGALEFLPAKLHSQARELWDFLGDGPHSFDELASVLSCAVSDLNAIIGVLEIDGLVERISGNCILRTDLAGDRQRTQNWTRSASQYKTSSQYKDGFEGQHVFGPSGQHHSEDGKCLRQQMQSGYANGSRADLEQLRLRVVKFVVRFFNGVSRKYLQLYLAAFWCFVDKLVAADDFVFRLCLSSPPVKYLQLLQYVSPSPVKIKTGGQNEPAS